MIRMVRFFRTFLPPLVSTAGFFRRFRYFSPPVIRAVLVSPHPFSLLVVSTVFSLISQIGMVFQGSD